MKQKNNVILVDKNNNKIGTCEKIKAHKEAKLHRAFSIFVFNSNNELLLQQRAESKYHSGGLWSNTVCSHPKPNQNIVKCVKERLIEEMGFVTEVEEKFSFLYRSDYVNGLSEHEYDHVFIGYYDENPKPNPEEVMNYKWITIDNLKKDVDNNPEKYTSWFKIILDKFIENLK